MKFALRRPCADCPFLIDTSLVLSAGRMEEIAEAIGNDLTVFPCHKTTHTRSREEAGDESEEGEGYLYDGSEQACMGALAYTLREHRMLPVMARIACARGDLTVGDIRANEPLIEQPGRWKTW